MIYLLLIVPCALFAYVILLVLTYSRGRDRAKGYFIERKPITKL